REACEQDMAAPGRRVGDAMVFAARAPDLTRPGSRLAPAVDAGLAGELVEERARVVLGAAETEKTAGDEALGELGEDANAQVGAEVDEHVATEDDVRRREDLVRDQVVLKEEDVLAQGLPEGDASVRGRVVVGQGPAPARFAVARLEGGDLGRRED